MWKHVRGSPDWHYVGLLVVIMVLLQVIGPEFFRYESNWISSGNIWRPFTAHLVHVGWLHVLLNLSGLVFCVVLTSPGWSFRKWFWFSACLASGISCMLTYFSPEVGYYAGYSGILFGLFLLAAVSLFPRDRLVASLVIAGIISRVLMEQFEFYNFNTSELIGAPVVVDAHLYGLVIAIAIALIWTRYTMNLTSNRKSD